MSLFCQKDVQTIREDKLMLAASSFGALDTVSDRALLDAIRVAEATVRRDLKVPLEPTTFFPYEPSDEEIAALNGMPWEEDPGYDYDAGFFWGDKWGFIVANNKPLISVDYVRFGYPTERNAFYTIPESWHRLDKKAGQVRLVPIGETMTAPLNVFVMQVMGGGRSVPYMLQMKYVAGLKDAREKWPDLIDVILKKAVLNLIKGIFSPQSGSVSADGLSQSMSVDIAKYGEAIEEALFGPKGSHGGLWTAIHGLPGTSLGASQ